MENLKQSCHIIKFLKFQNYLLMKIVICKFNRKSKSLLKCKRWRATEFRTFLFHTGPVGLKSVLKTDKYLNIIFICVAATILSNSIYMKLCRICQIINTIFKNLYNSLWILKENVSHSIICYILKQKSLELYKNLVPFHLKIIYSW